MTTVARTASQSFFEAAFEAIAPHVRSARSRRARRIGLLTLMDMDAGRLDDLGLNAQDVADALAARPPAPVLVAARRAIRGMSWTPDASLCAERP